MKKFFLCFLLIGTYTLLKSQNQLTMHVNNDILDCPHFSMLLDEIVKKKFNGTLIEKNTKEHWITYQIPSSFNSDEGIISMYRNALDSIRFPASSIKEIKVSSIKKD